jgi:hypothetical protein
MKPIKVLMWTIPTITLFILWGVDTTEKQLLIPIGNWQFFTDASYILEDKRKPNNFFQNIKWNIEKLINWHKDPCETRLWKYGYSVPETGSDLSEIICWCVSWSKLIEGYAWEPEESTKCVRN